MEMRSSNNKIIAHDFFPFFKVHVNGYIERCVPIKKIPASHQSHDPYTCIRSKDVIISSETAISARIFIPKIPDSRNKLPVLVYFHGGGFSVGSAFDPVYDNYATSLVVQANVLVVSVEYRLAPENPIPACYDDSWAALQWVASHANGHGPDPWLSHHGDFGRVFMAGDSAGANIAYNLAVRIGSEGLPNVKIEGMVLAHPFFVGTKLDRIWLYMCPRNRGLEDPRIKPAAEDLARLGCERVLVFVASKDQLRDAGRSYCEELKNSGWKGTVKIVEHEGVGHTFHLFKPNCEQALYMMKSLVSFINQEKVSWRSKI